MEIIKHQTKKPDSWNFDGANWEQPDPKDPRYWYAVILALQERAGFSSWEDRWNANTAITKVLAELAIAGGDATIGKHCPVAVSGMLGGGYDLNHNGDCVQIIRRLIRTLAPYYIDKSKLKDALNLKQTDGSTGTWKINNSRASVYMPKYSYATFAAKYPGLTAACTFAAYYFREDIRKGQSSFLAAAKKCVDDMFLIPLGSILSNGGYARVSSKNESEEGFDDKDVVTGGSCKAWDYTLRGYSGYPGKKKYSLSYRCSGDLYSQKDAMKKRIFEMNPTSASKAVSDAIACCTGSPVKMDEAVPNPSEDGTPVEDTEDVTWYKYPRTDYSAKYQRNYVYDQERKAMSNDFYKSSLEDNYVNVSFGDYLTYTLWDVQSIMHVTNQGTSQFSWSEPRQEGDPEGKEYDDGEETIGPMYGAELYATYHELEVYPPLGFEKGTTFELYSFPYIRHASTYGETTDTSSAYRFSVPAGSNLGTTEMEVSDPVVFKGDSEGKIKVKYGSKDKFPENVVTPDGSAKRDSYNGYYAYVWGFFNGSKAFKFKPLLTVNADF